MKFFTRVLLIMALFLLPLAVSAQYQVPNNTSKTPWLALKTNLFYGAYTYTPNLGAEIGLSDRGTLDIGFGYNPWNYNGTEKTDANGVAYIDNKKLVHLLGEVEYRYWLCQRFSGHFFGVHALGSQYNISEHEIPLLFGEGSKNHRYQGWAAGAGISYGYQFLLGKNWNIEANIGVGFVRLQYDEYGCGKCDDISREGVQRDYMGPTKAGISIMYIF